MTTPQDPGNQPGYPPAAPAEPPTYAPPPGPPGYDAPTGPPAYEPMAAAPPPKPRVNWVAIVVLVGLVAVIGGGYWVFRDRLGESVTSLRVGDCIDEPSQTTAVSEVQHQPCNSPHDGEVFATVTDSTTGEYPGRDHFRDVARDQCLPQAVGYLGIDFNDRPDIDAGYFFPTADSWAGGDRGLTCYFYRVDGQKLTASVRGIGASPLP